MSGFISQESIDEVTNKTNIVQLISEYVPLNQRGNDYWGCCPFHNEKTPSFSVSPDKGFYYCFGCHASGTAFNFIMQMEKLSYPEAVEFLAKKAGVQLSYTDSGVAGVKEDQTAKLKQEYTDLYGRVANMFHYLLMETEAGKFALDYITKRGITHETLEKFKLGYAPADRMWLKKFLVKKNFSVEFLDNSGLFSKKYPDYAFFSDRLMFPIFNRRGEVVAMGGRFLRGDPNKSPKYLNSGDLIQYKKGNTLYGFNFAKEAIRQERKVIFCEGYMDCIAYHQCGINYAVAPLGTALTEEQIAQVKPFVDCIMLSFDSDGAGQNATRRAIYMCRRQNIAVKVIQLTGAKDPAEIMINFGAEKLTNDVNCAIFDNDYLLSKLQELYPSNTPESKAKALLDFFEYLDSLKSDVQKDACLEQLCRVYGIGLEAARKDYLNRDNLLSRTRRTVSTEQNEPAETQEPIKLTAELRAVITVVDDDEKYFRLMRSSVSAEDLEDPQAKKLFTIMDECSQNGSFSVSNILNRCESDELRRVIIPAGSDYTKPTERSVNDCIKLIRKKSLHRQRSALEAKIQELEKSSLPDDIRTVNGLLSEKMELDKQIALLKG